MLSMMVYISIVMDSVIHMTAFEVKCHDITY